VGRSSPQRSIIVHGRRAANAQSYLVRGWRDLNATPGTLYGTVIILSGAGTEHFWESHRKGQANWLGAAGVGFRRRSNLQVYDTEMGLRGKTWGAGAVICWDNYLPLLAANHVSQKELKLVCHDGPVSGRRDPGWHKPVRPHCGGRGRADECFVRFCNPVNRERFFPPEYLPNLLRRTRRPNPIVSDGRVSCVLDPSAILAPVEPQIRRRSVTDQQKSMPAQIVRGKIRDPGDVVGPLGTRVPILFQLRRHGETGRERKTVSFQDFQQSDLQLKRHRQENPGGDLSANRGAGD